jgi:hypothetical protein
MAIDEARRPRRIIEAPRPPEAGAPLLRMADRFQRALMPRSDRTAPSRARDDEDEAPSTATPGRPGREGEPAHSGAVVAHTVPLAPLRHAREVQGRASMAPAEEVQPAAHEFLAETEEEPDDGWHSELARLIARLCNGADVDIEGWSVTLPMKPSVLPATMLRLELSPHWLTLRFQTQSARSLALLSRYRSELETLLRESLKRGQQVDIDIA